MASIEANERVIVLARHGPPVASRENWLSRGGFREWMHGYDKAEVSPATPPPIDLVKMLQSLPVLLASPMPRARSSVRLIGRDATIVDGDLLVEAPLPAPLVPWPRLSVDAWWVLSRFAWLCGYAPGVEHRSEAWRRAREAAELLDKLAAEHGGVGVVAHGWQNHWIGLALRRQGWRRRERSGYGPWSRVVMERV
jgi:hypothetical protein